MLIHSNIIFLGGIAMVYWRNVNSVTPYTPPNHSGTRIRRIIGANDGMENMEVIIGEIDPGGIADPHYHDDIEQSMYILSGEMEVVINNKEQVLSSGDAVIIPKKAMHKVTSVGDVPVRFVLVYSPPLNKQY